MDRSGTKVRLTRNAAVVAVFALFLTGCAQRAAEDVQRSAAPFAATRDQAVAAIVGAPRVLPADAVARLQACYGDVQSKANDYAHFLMGVVSDGTYDDATNAALARDLGLSIETFDDCELKLQRENAAPAPSGLAAAGSVLQAAPLPVLSSDWVSPFATAVASQWRLDERRMQALSPAEKYDVIQTLQSELLWPSVDQIPAPQT